MKQNIYVVVKHQFVNDKLDGAWIVGTHYSSLDAVLELKGEYDKLAKQDVCSFAEWSEFGGVRGLVRWNTGCSWSIYVKEVEIEL